MFTFSKVMDQNIAPKIKILKIVILITEYTGNSSLLLRRKKKHSLKIICKSKHL